LERPSRRAGGLAVSCRRPKGEMMLHRGRRRG
jgi:hypothetical protein